ncbi:MAG: VanZ family protein [Patescibacteria group bacterium]
MENAYRSTKAPKVTVLYWWGPVFLWMGIIFFLSSRHSVTVSPEYVWNFLFFKSLHVVEYAVLFTLTARALWRQNAKGDKAVVLRHAFIVTILYAMTDELHQQFVPSRQGQPRDVIIDGIGAGLIWYCLLTLLPKAPPKLRNWAKNSGIPF